MARRKSGPGSGRARTTGGLENVRGWIRTGLNDPRVAGWLAKHRRRDLPTYLTALEQAGPAATLADPAGGVDSRLHLVEQWTETVEVLARPDTLPSVLRARSRLRVHPAAPWVTSATAAAGSVAVVAQDASPWVEAPGVLGVVAVTAGLSALVFRARPTRRDRRHRPAGTQAVIARAEALLAIGGPAALTSSDPGATDRVFGAMIGTVRVLEELEPELAGDGVLDEHGALVRAETPADEQAVAELLEHRAALVHGLLVLGSRGQQDRSAQRREEATAYQSILDDLDR